MNGVSGVSDFYRNRQSESASLRDLSARIGRDSLLVQASTGNTSIKLDGVLWIKASGKWLADAERDEIFVPVGLADIRERIKQNAVTEDCLGSSAGPLRASVETFMHAALPHRVVIHVHSVNTIAWAIRQDAQAQLTERLSGLRWQWIPYVLPGPRLGWEIEKAASRAPDTDVFVLGNHGLVVCGPDCGAAEELLCEVEQRLAVRPRLAPEHKGVLLDQLARISRWRLPDTKALHALGTDATSRRILKEGVLFPCQAIFLGRTPPLIPCSVPFTEVKDRMEHEAWPFLIVAGSGVMVSNQMTRAGLATLLGLTEVVQRIGPSVPIRYLSESEVTGVLTGDLHGYRESAERGAGIPACSRPSGRPDPLESRSAG